jgi:excinuclease UvrABC ATPase subunit
MHLPVGLLTCVTGVSGSGKSTLVNDTLFTLRRDICMVRKLNRHRLIMSAGWNISIK